MDLLFYQFDLLDQGVVVILFFLIHPQFHIVDLLLNAIDPGAHLIDARDDGIQFDGN